MSSKEIAIKVNGISKRFEIYDRPGDRLKQFIYPRLTRLFGKKAKQYFREFWALKGISFQVRKGEAFGIIGKNGSGKSTLLQLICGTLYPTEGSVQINGRVAAILELGSGFNPEFSGRENIFLNASVYGLSNEETNERLQNIIEFADIGDFIDQPVKTYSSGMMVRLAFAVIAHVDADILVIDEALAVGDVFFVQKCMRFIREFMKTGAIIFVSHDSSVVISLCTNALILDGGLIVQCGSSKEIAQIYLANLYHGDSKIIEATINPEALKVNKLCENDTFVFNPDSSSFGLGGASIISVSLQDCSGAPIFSTIGGEEVVLRVEALSRSYLQSPIIGFFIRDRLGQALFGDNTYLSSLELPCSVNEGDRLCANFIFHMPRLANGEYTIDAAIADGGIDSHVQHHWLYDAITFKSLNGNGATGLIGIPINSIMLEKL